MDEIWVAQADVPQSGRRLHRSNSVSEDLIHLSIHETQSVPNEHRELHPCEALREARARIQSPLTYVSEVRQQVRIFVY